MSAVDVKMCSVHHPGLLNAWKETEIVTSVIKSSRMRCAEPVACMGEIRMCPEVGKEV
jgi:hypothetical protein